MVHYMSSYLGICLKLSGTQGATGFKLEHRITRNEMRVVHGRELSS